MKFKEICENKLNESSTSNKILSNLKYIMNVIEDPSLPEAIAEADSKTQKNIDKQLSALLNSLEKII